MLGGGPRLAQADEEEACDAGSSPPPAAVSLGRGVVASLGRGRRRPARARGPRAAVSQPWPPSPLPCPFFPPLPPLATNNGPYVHARSGTDGRNNTEGLEGGGVGLGGEGMPGPSLLVHDDARVLRGIVCCEHVHVVVNTRRVRPVVERSAGSAGRPLRDSYKKGLSPGAQWSADPSSPPAHKHGSAFLEDRSRPGTNP